MDKKDKLKCYTLKANDGHMYTTCDDKSVKPKKKKVKLVLKQPKEAATDAMNAIKEVRNISGSVKLKKQFIERLKAEMEKSKYEKVLKATKEFEEKKEAAKPKPKPANYDMLRPEIRKNILEFAGAKSPIDVARDELIELTTEKRKLTGYGETYVFFVINNTLDKIGSRNLGELGINTTYKKTPRARTIFLRDPIEVLKEYRKRTGEVKYKNVIERSLNRVKVYYKIMSNATAPEKDKEYKPTREQQAEIMEAVIVRANSQNLLKNNFVPKAVKQDKKGGKVKNTMFGVTREQIRNFRTDGIIDYIDGGLGMGLSSRIHLLVVMERLYINARSEKDFTELMKMMNMYLVKTMKETIIKNKEKRERIDTRQKEIEQKRKERDEKMEEIKRLKDELDNM